MTMITATYPLPIEAPQSTTTTTDRRAWGFWATLGWFGGAVVTYLAVSVLCGFGYALWWVVTRPSVAIDLESPMIAYLATALSMPAAALLLIYGARRAGPTAFGYIGLTLPARRHMLVGLALTAAFWCASVGFFYLFPAYDQSPQLIQEYRAILGNPAALAMYWITLAVTAPVFEEIIFRGFLMRGWSESRIGAMGAVALSSLAFAVVHVQYNLPTMTMVLGLGLVLGLMRWRSGSTTLTIMLHMTWNLVAGIMIALHA
jgi:membrane protease YdiL (CAAX protease family)